MLVNFWNENFSLPFQISKISLAQPKKDIFVIRDDMISFGFGTKVRKIEGLIKDLKSRNKKQILLWGSLHGNYLASYCHILYLNGFQVHVLAYSRDPNFKSANQIIVENHSSSFQRFSSKDSLLVYLNQVEKNFEVEGHIHPEFGFHRSALPGLSRLWENLESKMPGKKTIFLEIGSGMTFLSSISCYLGTEVKICGISVGEAKHSYQNKIKEQQKYLGLIEKLPTDIEILDPLNGSKFSKTKESDKTLAMEVYESSGVLIEPIYGTKTWEYFKNPQFFSEYLPEPWVYLHQGGQLNHLDIVLGK